MDGYLESVDEQERIARNQPSPNIDKSYPKVTDGTTSSIIQKTPRRIIQQLPTGKVKSDKNDWLAVVAEFIYTSRIIPNANEQYALLQKCWLMTARSMAHGCSHSMTPFLNRGDYFGTDMTVPYIKNVKFEAGKLSDTESHCIFVEAWYQESDIDAIIANEKKLKAGVKQRQQEATAIGEQPEADYEASWDIKALEEVKTQQAAKTDKEESKSSKRKTEDPRSGIKLIHAFQRGKEATFYTFHESSKAIVRRKKNKDPRGEMPIQTMYFETDGLSPMGRGIVEQVGSLQNLMDSEMQMYQYNRALMLNPPIVKRGSFAKSQLKFRPNAVIDMGTDPNANVDVLKIDTTAIANFPANYGLMKSQLLNLTASPDTSISSEIGNPGFSKTPAGVKAVESNVSVDDNYIRKQFETWFERWSETAINLYFAERTGTEELQLDEDTAESLKQLIAQEKLDPSFLSEDNKIMIDYDSATEALKFEVDASTSNMKNDEQQLEALDGLLTRLETSPILQQTIPPEKILGAWNAIVQSSGVENPEALSIDIVEWKAQQQQQMEQEQMQMDAIAQGANAPLEGDPGMMPQEMGPGMENQLMQNMPGEEMGPEQPGEAPTDDLAFIQALQDMGYSDEKIQQAVAMDQMGVPNEEIMQVLEMSNE